MVLLSQVTRDFTMNLAPQSPNIVNQTILVRFTVADTQSQQI